MKPFDYVIAVDFEDSTVTDKVFSSLETLWLNDTQVSDAGLENLKGLTDLKLIWLDRSPISDVGLEVMKGLSRLQQLSIKDTAVTDEGAADLMRALSNLRIVR